MLSLVGQSDCVCLRPLEAVLNAAFKKIDPSDGAVLAWRQLGKGKPTPKSRVLSRFHTALTLYRRSRRKARTSAPHMPRGLYGHREENFEASLWCLESIRDVAGQFALCAPWSSPAQMATSK